MASNNPPTPTITGTMYLHAVDDVTVDWSWDWTVVILGLYVERTSTDDLVAVEKTSVDDIVVVEKTCVNGIVAADALLGMDVVEDIEVVVIVDCFDVVDDVEVDVDNVDVVVVDRVDWVIEGRIRSPLQFRVKTTSDSISTQ